MSRKDETILDVLIAAFCTLTALLLMIIIPFTIVFLTVQALFDAL